MKKKLSLLAGPYGAWMLVFTIVPLLFIAYYAFTTADGTVTLNNFAKLFKGSKIKVLLDSLLMALECTALCLLFGYPAAYFLAHRDLKARQVIVVLLLLPMWMNFLLRTYAMMSLLESEGILSHFLQSIGLGKLDILGTRGAVLLGMVYNFLPFMILPIYTVLKKIDVRVIEAAEDLGASPVRVLSRVVVPLSVPGIVSGITMVFMPAVTTFSISYLLGNGMISMVGNLIDNYYITFTNRQMGSALSLLVLVLVIAAIGVLRLVDPKGEGGGVW